MHTDSEKLMNYGSLILAACLFWLLVAPGAALSQQKRRHRVGNIDVNVTDDDREWNEVFADNFQWPVGRGERNRGMQIAWTRAIHVGQMIDLLGNTVTDKSFGGHLDDHIPIAGTFKKVVRREPPTITVNGQAIPTLAFDEVDPNMLADEMTFLQYKFGEGPGFLVTRRTYAFANTDFDDFIILDYEFEMTRDIDDDPEPEFPAQDFFDVTFGFNHGFQISPAGNRAIQLNSQDTDVWGSWTTFTGSLSGRPITFTYIWDGDSPDVAGDDTGDPATTAVVGIEPAVGPLGRFLSEAYVGFGPLQVSTAVNDLTGNDETQPFSMARRNRLDVFGGPDTVPGQAISSGVREKSAIETDPNASPPSSFANLEYQGYGPYPVVSDGDKIRIVICIAFGGISQELTISEGAKWQSGAITDDQKNALLATGLDSLKNTIDRAAFAWDSGLAVPEPPPSPDLVVNDGPGKVLLSWSDVSSSVDRDTGQADFAEYRVYRADEDFLNPFRLVHTTTSTSYEDTAIVPGISYYYYVTAVDDDGNESSVSLNRMEGETFAARPFEPGKTTAQKVVAVPNPFIITAGSLLFAENSGNTIKFFNLPAVCTLKIYTETGDLLSTIEHTDLSDREDWDLQTDQNQFPATGLYIIVVTNGKDLNGNSVSDGMTKFVVIR
ncbi:MAG: hypothetical protein ACE5IR_06275 [bacterium]